MALSPSEEIAFDEDDLDPVVSVVRGLTAARSGWLNLRPQVEPEHEPPPRSLVVSIFSARGEPVPLATWTAPKTTGGPTTLGIEHGSGPKALARLADQRLGLDAGWSKIADHPRRGLVVSAHGEADPADVVWWLLAATHALSVVPLSGVWIAQVYRR